MPKNTKGPGPNKTGGGGGSANKTGGSANKTGGSANKTGGSANKTGGSANKTGGSANKTGGSANKTGGSANKTGGSANKTGGQPSSNKPGSPQSTHLGEPLSGLEYTLTYSGQEETEEGVTDDEGKLESDLPRGTDNAIVNIAERDMRLDIGDLDPPDTLKGYAGRLFNLDYYRGPISDRLTPKLYEAICKFQQDNEIPPLGKVDQETTDKLVELYGC